MARRHLEDGEVMRLALSSAAAPDADFDELVAACVRRGFAGLELREGDTHGIGLEQNALERVAAVERAAAAGVAITGYRYRGAGDVARLIRLARSLGAPLLGDSDDTDEVALRIRNALNLRDAGADAVVVVRGASAVRDAWAVAAEGLSVAWDTEPESAPLAPQAEALLRDCGAALRQIRLTGGGPEAALQEGQGIGALLSLLALHAFGGDVVLAPSSHRFRIAWQNWLGRRGGWGCGSKAEAGMVPLAREAAENGAGR